MKSPGSSVAGFGVDDNFCAGGREWTLVKIVGAKEEGEGRKFGIETSIPEEV